MASTSSSLLISPDHDQERPDLESIRVLLTLINHHIHDLLADAKALKSLKLKCTFKLRIRKQEFFEFSEHSIVSNLYWGIESVEAAVQAKWPEDRTSRLKNAERMLQVPALLDEHGITARIPNHYLICCSYFYLSLVRRLQRDEWQVAVHFLQALLISPGVVHLEFAPELCRDLFLFCIMRERQKEPGARSSLESESPMDFDENEVGAAIRSLARKYKAWLMYYQVMSYGEVTQRRCEPRDGTSLSDESQYFTNMKSSSTESSNSDERGYSFRASHYFEKVHPLDTQEYITNDKAEESMTFLDIPGFQDHGQVKINLDQLCSGDTTKSSNIKCLQDTLKESQSDTPFSLSSFNCDSAEGDSGEYADDSESSRRTLRINADNPQAEICGQKHEAPCSMLNAECSVSMLQAPGHPMHKEANEINISKLFSRRFSGSFNELDLSTLQLRDIESHILQNCQKDKETMGRLQLYNIKHFDYIGSMTMPNYQFCQINHQESSTSRTKNSSFQKNLDEVYLHPEENAPIEQAGILEKIISKLCFSEELGKCEEDYTFEITMIYEMLNNKAGLKYSLLKGVILDQLLMAISTSKEERAIRASMSILSTIMSRNKSIIEDIKKKGLQLVDLARALKNKVHEAAILIYLINPSPAEIKTLELLPTLVEVVCAPKTYKGELTSLLLTPPAASLMIIEVLVTAFDYATNNMHLAAVSSPRVLAGLLAVPRNNNVEEYISLAAILVRCMQFDGQCRKYISQFTPPFISLLRSNQKRASLIALEFFHEILHMPRSSAIILLQRIQKEGSINNMCVLLLLIRQAQPEYRLLAASLLLQLDMLEDSSGKIIYRETAMEALLESVACDENPATQQISAFILSNLGGTHAWTGEPHTIAWLAKKAGLISLRHRNLIRNFDWSDQSLEDVGIDQWSSKIARRIIKFGKPVFHALEKGLKSKTKRVSRDCLTAIAWLGCEIGKSPDDLRYSACEILLSTLEQYVHPGLDLEERLLACLCIYNYTSGKGMQKLIHFSEGVRESLRRLSNITWMAEELLKVADYLVPNKWRISCVHTQILEAGNSYSGAVSALIYYKGQLYSGYTNGSIKVWDIKGQSALLLWDMKEHKTAVTCFSLYEPGNCLLSGSADKTIRIWKMVQRKLELLEVIATKEPIRSLDTYRELIFAITQSHKMKVFDASRKAKDLFKNKRVNCIKVTQGKVYAGCVDSSIQELVITNNRQQEIKAPSNRWRMQNRPINSIALYKDWLYSASTVVQGSNIKDWRRNSKAQMSMATEKGANVLAMEVVEDFIYLNCSSSMSILQIWLRGTQHRVGRLSAGSKITSLLTANDMVLCGTETGLIKGWIPL